MRVLFFAYKSPRCVEILNTNLVYVYERIHVAKTKSH